MYILYYFKNYLKKIPRFLLIAITTVIVVLGLSLPGLTQKPVTVSVLIQALESTQWQPIIDEFHKENPNIRIQTIEGPNETDLIEDLYTSSFLLGNSPYDLAFMDIVWVPKFAAAGWLVDLSDRMGDLELSQFVEGDVNGGRYQGKLYRIPFRSDIGMLYYRADLLEASNLSPPETFDDLIQISQNLQQQGVIDWGYVWQGKQYEGLSAMFVEILSGFGAFWIDEDTLEVGLDKPEAIEAVKFLRSTIEKGVSPSGVTTYAEEDTRRLFQNGKAVFLRNWPYVYALSLQDDSPLKGKLGIKPMVSNPMGTSGACQGGWGFGIAKSSKHKEAAWKVIQFFSREDIQKEFILRNGYVPSRKSLFNDPDIVAKYDYYPDLLKVVNNSVLRPPIAQYSQATDILQRHLSAALTNRKSPEAAMKDAANETRRLLR